MKIKALSEVKYCSPTIMWFYDKFRPQIADVRTVQERNGILSSQPTMMRKTQSVNAIGVRMLSVLLSA